MLEVQVLGPVRLLRGGAELELGGVKQRAVLALLALQTPRAVSVASIIDGIWGENPPATARNAIQVYISGLRKAVGDSDARIERSGESYRLVGADLRVDFASFTQRVTAGRSALRSGSPQRAVDLLHAALASWDGVPLSGLEPLPLHAAAAGCVEQLRTTARSELIDALLHSKRLPDAVSVAQQAVHAMPLDEHGWAQLAAAQYHCGAQADALQTLRSLRSMLRRELGVDPSPQVARVEAAIRSQTLPEPWAHEDEPSAAPSTSDPPVLPSLPPLVIGRDEVIGQLDGLLAPGRIVTLVGLGGMGKTTVAVALAHRLARRGSVHFCELHADNSARSAMERICRQLGVDPGEDPVAALANAPADGVLVLDNAEQALGLGASLGSLLRARPFSVLVTSRVPLRTREEYVVRIEPLSTETKDGPSFAAQLFLARSGQVRSGPTETVVGTAEQVATMLDGIPLAIELVAARTRALTVEQLLSRLRSKGGELATARSTDVPERQRSQSVVIESSLDALSPAAAALADLLGSVGGWATVDLVEEIFEDGEATAGEFVDALEDVVDLGLAQLDGDGRVRLRPPVLDYLLGRSVDRRAVDDRVGRQVERLVAHHAAFLRGPQAPQALQELGRNHDTIVATLARGLETAAPERVQSIVLNLDRYWMVTGRLVEGRRWIEAVRLLDHDPVGAARLELLAGAYTSYFGDDEAIPRLDAAVREGERLGLPADRLLVNGACCLAAALARRGDHDVARLRAADAVRLAAATQDDQLVALARDVVGFVAAYAGDHEVALDAALAGIQDARRGGDLYDLVSLLAGAGETLVELDRGVEAVDLTQEAFALSKGLDVGPVIANVLTMHGLALTRTERIAEAHGCLLEALRISQERYPDPLVVASILTILAAAATISGDGAGAAELWGAADAYYADLGATPAGTQGYLGAVLGGLRERLGPRTETLRIAGAASSGALVQRLLASV